MTRYFAASARELLTHTLHQLAPNYELGRWPDATSSDFPRRPTRRLRVKYILRGLAAGAYGRFVDDDVRRTVDLLDALNKHTHSLAGGNDPKVLRLVLRRVEGVLAILLEAGSRGHP